MKHLVLIPSYNTGARLRETVRAALSAWPEVWVVIDGSDDGSDHELNDLAETYVDFKILRKTVNSGKGAAVFYGAEKAQQAGYTHVLVMDADGQHPADSIQPLLRRSRENPAALVMGQPVFGPEVPKARLFGRQLTIFWTELETLRAGLGDTLFGMRVYPLRALWQVMRGTRFARGFDFDPEVAVRLVWAGVRPVQLPVPVRYFSANEGGVSHFNYLRDNAKLTFLHFRLMPRFLLAGAYQSWRAKKTWNRAAANASQQDTCDI